MLKKTLLGLALALAATSASALEWSDNAFTWSLGWNYREPGVGTVDKPVNIGKQILSYTHVDGYKWGSQFFNIDMLMSQYNDPTATVGLEKNNGSNQGATEVYAVYRNTFSFNKIGGTKTFSFPGVRDMGVVAGLDISTKNTTFAPHKVMPVLGLGIAFDTPGFLPGFINFDVLAQKEWNNNGLQHAGSSGSSFGQAGNVDFNVSPMLSLSWGLGIMQTGLAFEGFANMVFPKGKDGFGADTKLETLAHLKLTYDVGTLFGDKGYKVGVGYEYWMNKFGNKASGNDATTVPGAKANAYWVEASIHF